MIIVQQTPLENGYVESVIEADSPVPFDAQVGIFARMATSGHTDRFRLVASYGGTDGILAVSDAQDNLDEFIEVVTSEGSECRLGGMFLVDGDRYDIIHMDSHRMWVIHAAGSDVIATLRRMGLDST